MKKLKKLNDKAKHKKHKKGFLANALLLKQTLLATWKSKLQLVILLLLSTFATALVTGSWISYNRIIDARNQLGLQNVNFNAVLPYSPVSQGIGQIANQAFNLKLGRFFVSETSNDNSKALKALYFDDTKIGDNQALKALKVTDLQIEYKYDSTGKIIGINNDKFNWQNEKQPLTFDLQNTNVKASMYGQLSQKAIATPNLSLKKHYQKAADQLYQDIFLRVTAPQILLSLKTFFADWIKVNANDEVLNTNGNADCDKFTKWLLENRVNYRKTTNDKTIPDWVDISNDKERAALFQKVVKETDIDPRASDEYGMNGQWMRIYRNFDANETENTIYTNFSNYKSPYKYNQINDTTGSDEKNLYSYYLARAAAALQGHDIYVRNQFNAIAASKINIKVVDIGFANAINHTNLKVFEGVAPTSSNEIVITPQFARKNSNNRTYRPGDTININSSDFIISGIGGDAYDIYPTLNDLEPVPNTRTEYIAYAMPAAWHNSKWFDDRDKTDTTLMYFTPWNDFQKSSFDKSFFDDFFQKTIFSDNGMAELNQFDYNNYLINKYGSKQKKVNITQLRGNSYNIVPNQIITSDDSQFWVYSGKKDIFDKAIIGFKYAALSGVCFLLIIVVFITTLIVKKAVQQGQISMGILKSIGYKTWQITVAYLAYPLITLMIAIPIGWIVGLALQVYLTEIFNTLFVLPYNVFSFNIVPLFIAVVLIVGFIMFTTLITAFGLLKKDVLKLIKKDSDLNLGQKNRNSNLFKNNFRFRFLLSLSKTSWKKIMVTSSVISLATLSIVATTAIPATINSLKTNYFKSQKYKNYFEYQTPMPNMPLSKYGLYAWNYFDRPKAEPYYPVYGAMPWPEDKIIYGKDNKRIGWYNPLDFKKENNTNNFAHIFVFDANFPDEDKAAFLAKMSEIYQQSKTGTLNIDDLIWSYSWLGGKSFSNQVLKELSAADKTPGKRFSSTLINFVAIQLPTLLSVANPGVPPGPDAITEILKQVLPGFVRQSIDSLPKTGNKEDPYDYFAIGHNTIAFNPRYNEEINGPDEELITQFKLGTDNSTLAKKGFMDIVGINPNTHMITLNGNEVNDLKYKENAKTIPIVINRAFQAKFNLKVGSTFNGFPNVNTLFYKNNVGKDVPLPKSNWYYGTEPPATIDTDDGGIWTKNGTKWNYRGEKPVDQEANYYDTQGTRYSGMYDQNGKPLITTEPNTWNNMNNIWLKLPADITSSALSGTVPNADDSGPPKVFNLDNISIKKGNDIWIKPFSYDFVNPGIGDTALTILLQKPAEWFMGMVNNGVLTKQETFSIDNVNNSINNMKTWWKNITGEEEQVHNYCIVGVQDSYDTPKAFIDQQWANKIMGYDCSRYNNNAEGVYQWFNGKISANDNIFDIIGRMSYKSTLDDYTIYGTTNLNGNKNVPIVANSDLLSRKKAMLTKMSDIAFSASALFIVTTIICSILIVIMITDLFTDQFRRFMAHMKAEGYTNREINSFTLGIFTPWALFAYIAGFGLGFLTVFSLIKLLTAVSALVLPFAVTWWILPASFVVIFGIYASTFIINTHALNKMNLIELLKSDE